MDITHVKKQATADYFVVMRIFSNPGNRSDWRMIVRQVEDLMRVAEGFGANRVETSEPCSYRTTNLGKWHLSESLQRQCISRIAIAAGNEYSSPHGGIRITISLGGGKAFQYATMHEVTAFLFDREQFDGIVTYLKSFIRDWFVPIQGISAFIDALHEPNLIMRETKSRLGRRSPSEPSVLREWQDVTRFVDSARWGMALSPQMYQFLGTQEQVLKTAPVAIAKPIGDAVWLQVSDEPPASEQALATLSEYIHPLLLWTDARINHNTKRVRAQRAREAKVDAKGITSPVASPIGEDAAYQQEFPLIFLEHEYETVINIHFAAMLEEEAQECVADIVINWWRLSFTGIYSLPHSLNSGIEYLSYPNTCGSAMRWIIKWGETDSMAALTDLSNALRVIDAPKIERIVIGVEIMG